MTVHTALFTIAKRWDQPKCPSVDEWINKMQYIFKQQDIIHPLKRDETLIHAPTRMTLENMMMSERSQAQNITYYTIPFT